MNSKGTWVKGMTSPNPQGRGNSAKYRYSIKTPLGMLERFREKVLTLKELERLYQKLDAKNQFSVWQMVYRELNLNRLSDEELEIVLSHLKAYSDKQLKNEKT
jgi:hypothetical protein